MPFLHLATPHLLAGTPPRSTGGLDSAGLSQLTGLLQQLLQQLTGSLSGGAASGGSSLPALAARSQSVGTSGSAAAGATDPSAELGSFIDPINDLLEQLIGGVGGASPLSAFTGGRKSSRAAGGAVPAGGDASAGLNELTTLLQQLLQQLTGSLSVGGEKGPLIGSSILKGIAGRDESTRMSGTAANGAQDPSAGLGSLIDRIKNLLEQLTGGAGGGSPLSALTSGGKSGRAASGPGAGLRELTTLLQRLLQQLSGIVGGGAASL
ncbi:hypothetical protein C8R43DRAFT_1193100 [Mycena crocata]|nr:hypothetical protein C8R43DRAFT_1193100 [Mycena crocata]